MGIRDRQKLVRIIIQNLLTVCIVSVVFPLTSWGQIRIGVGGGICLPTGNLADYFGSSPEGHGTLLLHMTDSLALEGELTYWNLQNKLEPDDFKASFTNAIAGLRLYLGETPLHVDIGGGAYHLEMEGSNAFEESDDQTGVYYGVGIDMGTVDLVVRGHSLDSDNEYIEITGTLLFGSRGKTEHSKGKTKHKEPPTYTVYFKNNTQYVVDFFVDGIFKSRVRQNNTGRASVLSGEHSFTACPEGLSPPSSECYTQTMKIYKNGETIDLY